LEELIIIVIQFVVEVAGQALVQIPFDCITRNPKKPEEDSLWRYVLFLSGGSAVGWGSVGILPRTMLHLSGLRIANLVLAPMVAAVRGTRSLNRKFTDGARSGLRWAWPRYDLRMLGIETPTTVQRERSVAVLPGTRRPLRTAGRRSAFGQNTDRTHIS
jgi:hypothetical protein